MKIPKTSLRISVKNRGRLRWRALNQKIRRLVLNVEYRLTILRLTKPFLAVSHKAISKSKHLNKVSFLTKMRQIKIKKVLLRLKKKWMKPFRKMVIYKLRNRSKKMLSKTTKPLLQSQVFQQTLDRFKQIDLLKKHPNPIQNQLKCRKLLLLEDWKMKNSVLKKELLVINLFIKNKKLHKLSYQHIKKHQQMIKYV